MENRRAVDEGREEFAPPNVGDWMNLSWDQSNIQLVEPDQLAKNLRFNTEETNFSSETNMSALATNKISEDALKTKAKLVIVRQPEEQHRARYLSEGSRGAIKDRSGSSHCTIQLTGYYRPTRVEIFAANGAGPLDPHPLYKLIPVSGKTPNTTPCKKIAAQDGVECLEVTLRPENQMTAVLDCMGILKICSYDVRQQKRQRRSTNTKRQKTANQNEDSADNSTMAATSTRICFRAYVLDETKNNVTILKSYTEPIRCVQQLGVPEVLKMSLSSAPARGGMDLFIIGRNFDRNTSVLFREYNDEGTIKWSTEAAISKPYFHQCHIVCAVPKYPHLYRGGTVSITVKCGQKSSHPTNFVYVPCEEERDRDEWCPPASPRFEIQRNQNNNTHSLWAPPTSIQSTFYNNFNDDTSVISPANGSTSTAKFMSTYFDYDQTFVPTEYGQSFDRYDSGADSSSRNECKRQRLGF